MLEQEVNYYQFLEKGYLVLEEYYSITDSMLKLVDTITIDTTYKNGKRFLTHDLEKVPQELRELVCNKKISQFFNLFEDKIPCRDVMITHDYLNEVEINQYLHFDRWRSLKAMVYLTDVYADDGPFSVVPCSQANGAKFRRLGVNIPYAKRANRIKRDFPENYEEPLKITAKAGTLILFDSDIFHSGGDVSVGRERKLIRSHWYYNRKWQEIV